ncbi:MAG: tRNA (adenosine(37)-N6)-threonylcarbamoyltransferase complex transferase subunit TsaD [Bacteroidales bacterium]|nr:tRNA (adenosine(37)-N6)-threonylcarbamoyltransferase complex transferase subunit TsaD [Bacteroidales bacterium]MCF8344183.1 tRNA (adenosine(37)-N6)-threonylcarbamoyltransferase complex transferase subunit TsaD [Bacteroidales bacterium]MCF8350518.1 tRNA (adenosine(37)-N6)-threonylcarbamoyltransferase complex transferase subunit TsaD [Bacteroidales bacterium]MCF8375209.1 tRNA (adenosine(37)-N6)-threonylcarbamoyltransferase complex transferase subunit TsaD [Bacteroidales bacterium]MCF8400233.1 
MGLYILGIESSCDDTSAAVSNDTHILANTVANQDIHRNFGGVVPELASRAHQQNIIPVIEHALKQANISKNQLHAIAFTRGPGLLGSLLVGGSFAKSMALALGIPIIEVDHMQAHILAHFISNEKKTVPLFPFLCLTVSGGHTQIVKVNDHFDMEILGQTIDDAAGEAFDKASKIMGETYPGGPVIQRLSQKGNSDAIRFPKPDIPDLNFSFSGLKTSFLYHIRDQLKSNPHYVEENKNDLAASIQKTIVEILTEKLKQAAQLHNIDQIAIAGGVSANAALRDKLKELGKKHQWDVFIPRFEYTTDNAAMIAITAYFKYLKKDYSSLKVAPYTRHKSHPREMK